MVRGCIAAAEKTDCAGTLRYLKWYLKWYLKLRKNEKDTIKMKPKVSMRIYPTMQSCRIVEKHALSTSASREAPVDKCARRHGA